QFLVWNKAGGKVMKGLVRRREAELALFLKK
ncbi:glycoside hydrolase family protein, partial [Acinetobacter baumannii]